MIRPKIRRATVHPHIPHLINQAKRKAARTKITTRPIIKPALRPAEAFGAKAIAIAPAKVSRKWRKIGQYLNPDSEHG